MGNNRFLDIEQALRPYEHMIAFEVCHTQKRDKNYRQNLNREQRLRFKRENELCISFSLLQPVLPTHCHKGVAQKKENGEIAPKKRVAIQDLIFFFTCSLVFFLVNKRL